VEHLQDDDREFLRFLLSLDAMEFKMLLNSMDDEEARHVLYLIDLAKNEIFDLEIDERGTPDADLVLDRVLRGIDKN
jgi:hypothetical protein